MSKIPFDLTTWNRKEHFHHYLNTVSCRYGMTVNLDITLLRAALKKRNYKLYPAVIHLLSHCVNQHKEFRMILDQDDQLYYFDLLNPSYTIFHADDETFSSTWTQYDPSFPAFYQNYLDDMQQYGNNHGMLARSPREDCFDISCLPWATFTEFHLDLPDARRFLLPIFTFGKYFEQEGKILLPLSVQVHHAVCDGFHLCRFVNEFQQLADQCEAWL